MNTPTPDPVPYMQHEREVLEVIDERDRAEEFADRLAEAVSALLGVPIGEHSSMNNPWQSALDAATAHMTALKPAERPVEPSAVPVEGWRQHALADKAYKALRESAVPVEGSGHPQPATGEMWCVCGAPDSGPCGRCVPDTGRPVLSLDTPEGATTNEH